jgi:hypothetical protein
VIFVRPGIHQRLKLGANGLPDDVEQALLNCHKGPDIWVLGGYLRLRRRGYNVELADDFRPGALCIAHRDDVRRRIAVLWRSFVVSVRADRERIFACDLEMVQSPASIEGPSASYVLHWPQPGLRARDPSRGSLVARLGYFGAMNNLGAQYRDPGFLAELASLGIELVIRDDPAEWSNYSDIDVVLAARDGSPCFLASKPAIKLFNAWLAGCPAFVSAEPAFYHHRTSEFDFMPVSSAQELLVHLRQLRENPALYMQFVQRARERAEDVTEDRVVEDWLRFFEQTAMPKYAIWHARAAPLRYTRSVATLGWNLFRQVVRGNRYSRGCDLQGNRIEQKQSAWRRAAQTVDKFLTGLERGALMILVWGI